MTVSNYDSGLAHGSTRDSRRSRGGSLPCFVALQAVQEIDSTLGILFIASRSLI